MFVFLVKAEVAARVVCPGTGGLFISFFWLSNQLLKIQQASRRER